MRKDQKVVERRKPTGTSWTTQEVATSGTTAITIAEAPPPESLPDVTEEPEERFNVRRENRLGFRDGAQHRRQTYLAGQLRRCLRAFKSEGKRDRARNKIRQGKHLDSRATMLRLQELRRHARHHHS